MCIFIKLGKKGMRMEFDDWLQKRIEEDKSKPDINDFLLTINMESSKIPMYNLYHGEHQMMTYMSENDVYHLYGTLKQWVDKNIEEKNQR